MKGALMPLSDKLLFKKRANIESINEGYSVNVPQKQDGI